MLKPDHSYEAEQALIGALLINNRSAYRIGTLDAEDFFSPDNRRIYEYTIGKIFDGKSVDVITILESDLPKDYVGQIIKNTPGSSNAGAYADIIRKKAHRRRVTYALHNAIQELESGDEIEGIADKVMLALVTASKEGSTTFAEAIDQGIKHITDAAKAKKSGQMRGAPTTLPRLTDIMGSYYGSRLYVLGGRPGTFKTAYALQVLLRAARQGMPVGMISLEMPAWELSHRALANEYRIDSRHLASGDQQAGMELKNNFDPAFKQLPIHIDDKSHNLGDIRSRIMEWRHREHVEFIVIDHIQLIRTNHKTRFEELAEISRTLKLLTMEIGIPIMVLSQLSRDVEKQKRMPVLSDLRECGNLEQDADAVIFTTVNMQAGHGKEQYQLVLAKNRGGPARKIIDLVIEPRFNIIGEEIQGGLI